MVDTVSERHRQITTEQFTRQAVPFAALHAVDDSVQRMIAAAGLAAADSVLDVACGPGLVACAFATVAARVAGIDLTPAMLDLARQRQADQGLTNLEWHRGDVTSLPFADGQFSVVVSRYALHHVLSPAVVIGEMARVCSAGGRVAVADVYTDTLDQALAYDALERLRDPSHARAVGRRELQDLFAQHGLVDVRSEPFTFDAQVERLLEATRTEPADAERFRLAVAEDVGHDRLGIAARRVEGQLWFSFPVQIVTGRKPG